MPFEGETIIRLIMRSQPTIFHITHHKAGSQWVAEILKQSAPNRIVLPKIDAAHFFMNPISLGGIYLTIYASREEFETIITPERWFHQKACNLSQAPNKYFDNWAKGQVKRRHPFLLFIVIRDLRDTLVSLYFSIRNSHPLLTDTLSERRKFLLNVSKEEGLIYLMDIALKREAKIQTSWMMNTTDLLVSYEELVADEQMVFERLINYCQIKIDQNRLRSIVKANTFETISGRKRGQEDITAHQRKGVVGDWRNHFSERVKEEFKKRFGEVLIKTGYECSFNW